MIKGSSDKTDQILKGERQQRDCRNYMKQNYQLKEFEKKIGYHFQDVSILKMALTHSSYANEKKISKSENNERIEFLGDAVLELITSEYLYTNYKEESEGELTKTRASIVCEATLNSCANQIQLGDYILLGKGELATGGKQRPSIISDAMEAVIGAIFLDGGFTSAKEFVTRFILKGIEERKLFYDSKTILQELVQGKHLGQITYVLVREEGPDHNKTFTSEVKLGETVIETGEGKTKKSAEQSAAYKAILKLRNQNK